MDESDQHYSLGVLKLAMKKQPIYSFYWFGTCLRYLQDTTGNERIKSDHGVLYNINEFYDYLDLLELVVTKRVASSKLDAIKSELDEANEKARLTGTQASDIRDAVSEIRITLDAELQDVFAYTPTPKRLDLEKLLSNVKDLFAPGVYGKLPEIARYDFVEAGKCIAYELPTSAAFHILRGTESALRNYYEKMVLQKRVKSLNWGPIVTDLKKRKKTKRYEALNNHLDNIRMSFRNPTQHPDAIYDIHEAQDLLAVCIDVVNKMTKGLKDNN